MLESGTLLENRYRVSRALGWGDQGAVYEARDEFAGYTVAVKETILQSEPLSRAWWQTAPRLHRLHHPALPRLLDYFIIAQSHCLIWEYIPGEDLGTYILRRQRPSDDVTLLFYMEGLLDALEYLHHQQPPMIHGDIKPKHLKETPEARARVSPTGATTLAILLECGAMKQLATDGELLIEDRDDDSRWGYTPLEQLMGDGADERSDLYALGATFYFLLTGRPPVRALARAQAVAQGQPDPLRTALELNLTASPTVAAMVEWAMALHSKDRPQTAGELRSRLPQRW